MNHIFDEKKFKKLDSPERRKALPIDEVLSYLPKSDEMTVADIGCGIGYFSLPFATHYKKVYAVDISEVMIEELKKRTTTDKVIPLHGDFNEELFSESIDVFFTATVIHEIDNLPSFNEQAFNKLKQYGYLVHLDFRKIEGKMGPPKEKRIAAESVIEQFEALGLKEIKHHLIKDDFYMVIGRKLD